MPYPKPPCTLSKPVLDVPTWPLRSPHMKSFSPIGTLLTKSSRPSQNSLLVLSLWPTCGAYALITLRTKSLTTSLTRMIRSPCLLTSNTPSLRLLLIKMPTPFLFEVVPVYHSLKPVSSTSFAFCPFHLVSWTHRMSTRLLTAVSTNSSNLPVRDPAFQLPKWILLGPANFLTLHTRRVKCEDPCSFSTTPGRRCSAPLKMRRPDPCSLITVSRSNNIAY